MPKYETLQLELDGSVAKLTLNRPTKANVLNAPMWKELTAFFNWADDHPPVRCIVLDGAGKNFCGGIDFSVLMALAGEIASLTEGRKQELLRRKVFEFQESFCAIERCRKPVIAAVHGACIGGGVDMITACDIRFAATDTRFSVKEVDLAIVADVGTLQRLPTLVPQGIARELAFTGREFSAEEAYRIGLVNRVLDTKDALMDEAMSTAHTIAEKSPLTIRGIKEILNYGRDHSVADGLSYVATWNGAMAISEDSREALEATFAKRKPNYAD